MDFLSDNPLANMRGPDFLVLYAIFACIAVLTFIALAALDDDGRRCALCGKFPPNPTLTNWLICGRGRRRRVAGDLRPEARGPYGDDESRQIAAARRGREAKQPIRGGCSERDRAGLRAVRDHPRSGAWRLGVPPYCASLESSLAARGLVPSPESRTRTARFAWWIGGALVAIAAYKVIVATAHGHRNIGGLLLECMVFSDDPLACGRALS